MQNGIEIYHYTREGLEKSYDNKVWVVGIKNYKPSSDILQMNVLEKHNLTDELFIPVVGQSILVFATESDDGLQFHVERMKNGNVYCVNKGTWHNVIMARDDKIVLVERTDTCMENSLIRQLSDEELVYIKKIIHEMTLHS